jgi:hypothetical protein
MATDPIATYVITKNTSDQWATANPVLAKSEVGVERDTGFFKIGDGIRTWEYLPYVVTPDQRGLIVFVSEDPDNLIEYGEDGGFKILGGYFDAVKEYNDGKGNDPLTTSPTRKYHQTIFTIGRDIKNILLNLANLEVQIQGGTNAVTIDDDLELSTDTTWSISKITDHVLTAVLGLKGDLLNNHAAAYDTLQSLAAYLDSDPSMATSLANEIADAVKIDTIQTLTSQQKAQARSNIDAVSLSELGTEVDIVEFYNNALGSTAGSLLVERSI